MNATTIPAARHTMQYYREKEAAVFRTIPGMEALLQADSSDFSDLEIKYPDAAFALMIATNLHSGDSEQNEIHQKAYASILNGDPIAGVRFRYDYDLEAYLLKHMWD